MRIAIVIEDGQLSLGTTKGMTVAEINLWLDTAKRYLLDNGNTAIDFEVSDDTMGVLPARVRVPADQGSDGPCGT